MRGIKAARPVADASTARHGTAVAIIDSALADCTHRSFLTQREAVEAVTRVRDAVDNPVLSAMAASIVNNAMLSFQEDQVVDRWLLIDPLLDLRRVLQPS